MFTFGRNLGITFWRINLGININKVGRIVTYLNCHQPDRQSSDWSGLIQHKWKIFISSVYLSLVNKALAVLVLSLVL